MTRRNFVARLGGALLAAALAGHGLAQSQQARIPRVGFLHPAIPQNNFLASIESLRQGLHELGYDEGRTIVLETRWAEGKLERLPGLAAELVRLKVDVIVAFSSPAVLAAKDATQTIPIVMPVSSDPVADGLVKSLARPGGNITGLSMMAPELGEKRLQILKEVAPQISRPVAVMWNPAYTGMVARFREAQRTAPKIGLEVKSVEVRDSRELESALDAFAHGRPDALLLLADPLTSSQRLRIVEFAAEARIPAIYETRLFAEDGGLISYGPNPNELCRRAATYVDKILKGARPGDLPIEQPSRFELVVNLKTAKALGLAIPRSILVQADKVIE
ncbi:MAG TPA: ABC transporter substrate-binding protein [Burkholderiales bacterium]|nr:ABC transporter substrate-binding protein [Burkholderiales bacterium]